MKRKMTNFNRGTSNFIAGGKKLQIKIGIIFLKYCATSVKGNSLTFNSLSH